MRTTGLSVFIAATLLATAGVLPIVAKQAGQPAGATQAATTQAPVPQSTEGGQSGYVLKIKTRLVSLDVIARDSKGNVVRDLKPEELQIFEAKVPQKTAGFEFIDRTAVDAPPIASAPSASGASAVYSNLIHFEGLKLPPTVLLMDALNTPLEDQLQARTQMIRLLNSLPPNTPIAVFLLGNSLRLVQGFTSDPTLLQTAVKKLVHPEAIEKNPLDDPNSPSRQTLSNNGELETQITQDMEDFAKEQYANSVDLRAHITLDTLEQVARYFSGISGRKNLIWLSESFPLSIDPDLDNGTAFEGTRNYGAEVEAATSALNDAQVAIYPVDLTTLRADSSLSASQDAQPRYPGGGLGGRGAGGASGGLVNGGRGAAASRNLQGGGLPLALTREDEARIETQQTMDKLATETGGQSCENQNGLADCIMAALNDSSSYYQLAFYPQGTKWDGKFHQLTVKTTRKGVTLNYRRGYFAQDSTELAKQQTPEQRLREACSDILPATSIHLIAEPVAADVGVQPVNQTAQPGQAGPAAAANGRKYLLIIDPLGMTFPQNGNQHSVGLQAATCQFNPNGDQFRFDKQDLSRTISNDTLQTWQDHGIPDYVTVAAPAGVRKVRFAVLDTTSGLTGAIDVTVDSNAPAPAPATATAPTVAPMVIKTTATLISPDRLTPIAPADHLTLRGQTGQAGTISWGGESITYQGDLPVEDAAPAFANFAFGAAVRCDAGASADDVAQLKLQLIFWNNSGKSVTVNLKGAQPEYSGDLAVDPIAKGFLAQVWRIGHCLAK